MNDLVSHPQRHHCPNGPRHSVGLMGERRKNVSLVENVLLRYIWREKEKCVLGKECAHKNNFLSFKVVLLKGFPNRVVRDWTVS